MTFREFLKLEQGTPTSVTGLNAAGRAGQSPFSPETGVTQTPSPNMGQQDIPAANGPKTVAPSSFNVSSKNRTNTLRTFGPFNAGGVKPLFPAPTSPLSPRGFQSGQLPQPKPVGNPQQIKIPKPGTGS